MLQGHTQGGLYTKEIHRGYHYLSTRLMGSFVTLWKVSQQIWQILLEEFAHDYFCSKTRSRRHLTKLIESWNFTTHHTSLHLSISDTLSSGLAVNNVLQFLISNIFRDFLLIFPVLRLFEDQETPSRYFFIHGSNIDKPLIDPPHT
jgi:hypothetical protein